MEHSRKGEKGQLIVMLALVMVVLLGFTGLAVDGGMIYSDRRNAQNAADAAALAGAGAAGRVMRDSGNTLVIESWDCNTVYAMVDNAAFQAAIASAAGNHFDIASVDVHAVPDDNQVASICNQGLYPYYDVLVTISSQTTTSFAQIIYNHPMVNVVHARARVFPRQPFGGGAAIISLNTAECSGNDKGMVFDGNVDVIINKGTVYSNSCIYSNGTSGVVMTGPTIPGSYVDSYYPNGTGLHLDPPPKDVDSPINPTIPKPDCSNVGDGTDPVSGTISPGHYTSIMVNRGNSITMNPGLYCISEDLRVAGGGSLIGNDVTLYFTGSNSYFITTSSSHVELDAPPSDCDLAGHQTATCPPALPGVLIYVETGSDRGVTLIGNSGSLYEGTVYAPQTNVEMGGNADLNSYGTQVIGLNVTVHGTPGMTIEYDASKIWHTPVKLQLHQ